VWELDDEKRLIIRRTRIIRRTGNRRGRARRRWTWAMTSLRALLPRIMLQVRRQMVQGRWHATMALRMTWQGRQVRGEWGGALHIWCSTNSSANAWVQMVELSLASSGSNVPAHAIRETAHYFPARFKELVSDSPSVAADKPASTASGPAVCASTVGQCEVDSVGGGSEFQVASETIKVVDATLNAISSSANWSSRPNTQCILGTRFMCCLHEATCACASNARGAS